MMRRMTLAIGCALALTASTAAPGATPAAPTHCRAGEIAMLSCTARSGKTVSLCATGPLKAAGAAGVQMQYRFGKPGEVEMAWPPAMEHPSGRFFLSATGYGGGGEERIRFSSGGYDYVVFQSMIAGKWLDDGHREHFEDAGVVVMKAGKVIGKHICRDWEADGFSAMYDLLQREEFNDDIDTPCCGEK